MQVGNYNIHLSPNKSSSPAGKSEKPGENNYMDNLKDVFAKATDKLKESKNVPGAFVANNFQVHAQQFLNIKDISSQFNGSSPVWYNK